MKSLLLFWFTERTQWRKKYLLACSYSTVVIYRVKRTDKGNREKNLRNCNWQSDGCEDMKTCVIWCRFLYCCNSQSKNNEERQSEWYWVLAFCTKWRQRRKNNRVVSGLCCCLHLTKGRQWRKKNWVVWGLRYFCNARSEDSREILNWIISSLCCCNSQIEGSVELDKTELYEVFGCNPQSEDSGEIPN